MKKIIFYLLIVVLFSVLCWQVILRVERIERRAASITVTIPEGFSTNQIAEIAAMKLPNFNKTQFIEESKGLEGYLFPDTYFFVHDTTVANVIKTMNDNFNKKITPLMSIIVKSGKSERNIIIMASIIEKEARGENDRAVISGILWKRLSLLMPLQVDSAPETYKVKGLPESPVGNPGLLAIKAAINPQDSSYLYYLHDKARNIHYAKTFAEHVLNEQKYLGN